MKKLSKLADETLLLVNPDGYGDGTIMDKASFLMSSEYIDRNPTEQLDVFVAEEECATFSFDEVLDNIAEDMFEDWKESAWDYLNKTALDFEWIESQINEAFIKCPAYYCGENIDIEN